MPAEVRMAQGCFVFGQQNTLQTDSLALVGRQPCIISCGRKSCFLASAPVGSVNGVGLFAHEDSMASGIPLNCRAFRWKGGMMNKIIDVIKGGGHVSVWLFGKLLITIDYWQSPCKPSGAKFIDFSWNPD